MRNQTLTAVVVVALSAASAGLFFSCFERGSVSLYRGASPEAQRNPYLAWERLLAGMGHEVRVVESPADLDGDLPPVEGTLFYPAQRLSLGKERSERLLRWVAAGGHLWVVTWTIWDDEDRRSDPILDPLDVRQFMFADPADALFGGAPGEDEVIDPDLGEELGDEPEAWEAVVPPDGMASAWPNVLWDEVDIRFGGGGRKLEVFFDRNYWLEAPDVDIVLQLAGETGAHLVRVKHGNGIVTAVTDDYLLRNDGIGQADHAEVALRLLRRGEGPGVVWMLPVENWPGLLQLLGEYGWALLSAGGIWLLAWVWRSGRRFGPLIPEEPPVRRSLLEHVEATGRLLGRGRRDVLVEAAREAVFDELRARRPGWMRLPPAELDERLAHSAAVPGEEIARALRGHAAASGRAAFTRAIATLERIRHTL